jgi:hypothetical protein
VILGISHIVLGTAALTADAARMRALGYDVSFVETDLPTHPGKRPFMAGASELQSLAFCPAPKGPSIELIAYGGALAPAAAPFQIIVPSEIPSDATPAPLDDAAERAWTESHAGAPPPRAANVPGLSSALWFGTPETAGTMVHFVADVHAARAFWTSLGWTEPKAASRAGPGWARLDFRSAVAQWRASLLLVESRAAVSESRLDTAGFRCLSILTSDLRADGERVRRAGCAESTGRMDYTVNQKPLAVEIFAGPDGAMIELLEVVRGAK